MSIRRQQSSERQRGYQLLDSAGAAAHDADGKLIFEIVYGQEPAPTDPQDGSGNKWSLPLWDNKVTTWTEVEPWRESSPV